MFKDTSYFGNSAGSRVTNRVARNFRQTVRQAELSETELDNLRARIGRGSKPVSLRTHSPSRNHKPCDAMVEPNRVDVDGVRWFVLRVAHGADRMVVDDLSAAGYRAYSPQGRRIAHRARVKGSSARVKLLRQFFVFAPYVFVGCPQALEIGRHCHDKIVSVVSDSCGPIQIPKGVIASLNALELSGQWYDTKSWRDQTRLKIGSSVRITGGPFQHLQGIVAALPAEMRVKVELSLFGRPSPVDIDACQLEPA